MRIEFESLLAQQLAAAAFFAVACALALRARGSTRFDVLLLALRLTVAFLLAAVVARPTFVRTRVSTPRVVATLDDSASLRRPLEEGTGDSLARAMLRDFEALARDRRVHVRATTLSGAPFDAPPATESPIRAPFDASFYGDDPTARAFFFTDGIENDQDVLPIKKNATQPVDAILLGSKRPAFDWRLRDVETAVEADGRARVSFVAELRGAPTADARVATATLWTESNGSRELLWETRLEAIPDATGSARASVVESADARGATRALLLILDADDPLAREGSAIFDRGVDALSGGFEFCVANNVAALEFDSTRKTRALLIDEEPSLEFRYLRELLRREARVELKTALFDGDRELNETDPLALDPTELDQRTLQTFDVVVLGDVSKDRRENALRAVDAAGVSFWALGRTPDENGNLPELSALEARLTPGAFAGTPTASFGESIPVVAAPSSRRYFDDASFAGATCSAVARGFLPRVGSETLLAAQPTDASSPVPILVTERRERNAVAWTGTDELRRLRFLEDKSVYRRVVLGTLDALTSGREDAKAVGREAAAVESSLERFAREASARAAEESETVATPTAVASASGRVGGATLDLRDVETREARRRAREFLASRLDALGTERVETRVTHDVWTFPCALAALVALTAAEWARRLGARCRDGALDYN